MSSFALLRQILEKEKALVGNSYEAHILTPDYRALEIQFEMESDTWEPFDRPGIRSWSKGYEVHDPQTGYGIRVFASKHLTQSRRKYAVFSYQKREGKSPLPIPFRLSFPRLVSKYATV
jgi:hypothetical protein